MRKTTTFALSTALASVVAFGAPAAYAAEVLVTGAGTWGSSTATTPYSAPGETYAFSFNLPDPVAANPTPATNFVYNLNGSPVTGPAFTGVQFYPANQGGLFDLDFGTGIPGQTSYTINLVPPYPLLTGPDVGSDGTLVLGSYSVAATVDGGETGPTSFGTALVTIALVPEPTSWALLAAGLIGFGMIPRRSA